MKQPDLFAAVVAETASFDQVLRDYEHFEVLAGCEGLSIMNAFRGLVDQLIGVINASIIKFTKIGDSIRRSELQEYVDTHVTRLRRLDNIAWSKLRGLEVDAPAGMIGTYAQAQANLRAVYTALNMDVTAKTFAANVKKLKVAAANDDVERFDGAPIRQFAQLLQQQHEALSKQLEVVQKQFTGERTGKVPLPSAIRDPKELQGTLKALLDNATRLTQLNELNELYTTANRDLTAIRGYDAALAKLDKSTLVAVADMVRYMAFYYEMYGIVTTIQAAVEHNYTLVIDAVLAAD